MLAENEISPALPEEDFKIIQPQLAAAVAGELQSPDHLAGRALRAALFPKTDPAQRETTPETIKSLTIQDVRDYHQKVFRPDLTTLVVIGNVTPEAAQAVISKYFGSWRAAGPKPNTLFPPAPPNAAATTDVPDASRVQDKTTLAETLGLTRTNADYYALDLGNHVLGGAFYASRLYRDLREKSGLVYFVSSSFNIGLTRGVYQVEYACDPPNVAKARAMIVSNLKEISAKNVTAHELRQAQVLLLRDIPLSGIQRGPGGRRVACALDSGPAAGRADAGGAALCQAVGQGGAGRLCQMAATGGLGGDYAGTGPAIMVGARRCRRRTMRQGGQSSARRPPVNSPVAAVCDRRQIYAEEAGALWKCGGQRPPLHSDGGKRTARPAFRQLKCQKKRL